MRILITRPEPGASLTAARLRALGHEVVIDPMLAIVETGAPLPAGTFDAVAFTSPNAARAVARHRDAMGQAPVFAVGSRTAGEARAAGFSAVVDCAGDVAALAEAMAGALKPGARVLHPAGEDRAGDLASALAAHGIAVVTHIAYRAPEAETLGAETRAALQAGTLDVAFHFSPRSADVLVRRIIDAGLMEPFGMLRHLCLSEAVAKPLLIRGVAVVLASRPNEDTVLALLEEVAFSSAKVAPGMSPV